MDNSNQPNSNSINNTQYINISYPRKSVILSYIFLIFFGWLGLHRFYVGKYSSGLVLLLLNIFILIVTALIPPVGILILISCIWLLYDLFTFFNVVEKINLQAQELAMQKFKNIVEKK